MQKIDVAAYIWPSYTGKEPRAKMFWPEGIGEWQTVKAAAPKFEGHLWPRKPLLGYKDEADPETMEEQIDLAASYGVNTFIYDWYWFDRRPFLEQCLDEGFLRAKNNQKMKFYIMWANHDADSTWDKRISDEKTPFIWLGKTVPEDYYGEISRRFLGYFKRENYYKVNGEALLSIYDVQNFIDTFGGITEAKKAIEYLDAEAKKAGLKGVHFQAIVYGAAKKIKVGDELIPQFDAVKLIGFKSCTNYQFAHVTNVNRPYNEVAADAFEYQSLAQNKTGCFYPHVSLGWDNNPRFYKLKANITTDCTPENIKAAALKAKDFALETRAPMITLNSWNEWTEGSYLLPDDLYGYGYLQAIKEVFKD